MKPRDFAIPVALLSVAAVAVTANMATAMPVGNTSVPQPAKPVELKSYLGKWYELARYENRFEKGCDGVTAEYSLAEDGQVNILNTCGQRDGKPGKSSKGKAKIVPESNNAKLKVSFFGPFYVGDYWVLDHADDYTWSIVGEPSGKYLWILSRNAHPSQGFRDELIKRVAELGYETKLIRETKH
jgi:apolipoprotein D and lipocalin family protein